MSKDAKPIHNVTVSYDSFWLIEMCLTLSILQTCLVQPITMNEWVHLSYLVLIGLRTLNMFAETFLNIGYCIKVVFLKYMLFQTFSALTNQVTDRQMDTGWQNLNIDNILNILCQCSDDISVQYFLTVRMSLTSTLL